MPIEFRLAEILAARGITQGEIASQAGVGLRTVSRLCTNQLKAVSTATLEKLANALGVEPVDLIKRRD